MKGRFGFYVVHSLLFIAIPSIAAIPVSIVIWLGHSPLKLRNFFVDFLGSLLGMAGIMGIVWLSAGLLYCRDRLVRKLKGDNPS